ncbi:sensor histidine kinase [Conexibacter woesei]|uniref:histidine kinase n=1 Tax=Conexibacter woesei (strain DSM 14684 / CCUG 47730 / CIP 108061 / JCM 11494 / NBRC 100937 / ID131577) TaxID=469383 RepID=D3F7M7_CONWI|nr:sensor histidine kinase [Conexibacter woesei]ADB50889.1 putative signal transduction histidine kinase [Conexibacter woesei DSM 14684]
MLLTHTEAPGIPSIVREVHAVVAAALTEIGERAATARTLVGIDDETAHAVTSAISRRACSALDDVRRLLDRLPATHPARRALADDIHDTVGHGVSLAGVLAGAARAALATDPPAAVLTLDRIAAVVAETEAELSELIAFGASPPPVDVAALADWAAAGQPVWSWIDDGALATAPPCVASAAHRIVQESLTNARKHAAGAPVVVQVGIEGDALVTVVANGPAGAGRPAGAASGIAGMRRRARAVGGQLVAGPTPAGGFRVHARLPLDR